MRIVCVRVRRQALFATTSHSTIQLRLRNFFWTLRAKAREITAWDFGRPTACAAGDGRAHATEAAKAESSRRLFRGGSSVVAGFEELAPEKLDAIELHAPMRFLVGTHGVDARRVLLGSGLPRRFPKEREAPCVLLLYAGG